MLFPWIAGRPARPLPQFPVGPSGWEASSWAPSDMMHHHNRSSKQTVWDVEMVAALEQEEEACVWVGR